MPSSKGKPRPEKKRDRPLGPSRRRYCHFCKEKTEEVDYKDYSVLRRFISDRGKIKPPRTTGSCRRHQRQVALAIKRAREMALLPYVTSGSGLDRRGRRRPR
ncbi:MAG TPA: 30S ribosomal protein S18 [Thermoleophilia bacterium]|nr:30S ribosomal protein S18 [Thermoleophilia bacterium]